MEPEAKPPPPKATKEAQDKRRRLVERLVQLRSERTSWDTRWKEICEQFMPLRARFLTTDDNNGRKREADLINGTPMWALGVLEAGMMSGITSPSRRWFKLITRRKMKDRTEGQEQYFYTLEGEMEDVLSNSNSYKCFAQFYADLGGIGTAVQLVEEDEEDIIRVEVLPPGQYTLANGANGKVDTLFRELRLTARQLVEKFTEARCSETVRQAMRKDGGQPDLRIDVVHCIQPNPDFDEGALGPAGMKWASHWWEKAAPVDAGFLAEEGFYTCPFMAGRWRAHGQDTYGSGPGMEALGDARGLQLLEKRGLELVEKSARPTMVGPASMQATPLSMSPGGMNFLESMGAGQKFEPAFIVDPRAIAMVREEKQDHVARINRAFHADLFLMLSLYDKQVKTATEVNELREEKMLQLGPVVESVFDELLDPFLERVYDIMARRGMLPPPPEELMGEDIKPQYISVLSQAQKLRGTSNMERLLSFVGNIAAVKPDVLDKIDTDQVVDEYAQALGTPPMVVRADEKVQEVRDARAKAQAEQQQQEQMAEQLPNMVKGAKTLSETEMTGNTALTRLLGNVGAPNTPGVA